VVDCDASYHVLEADSPPTVKESKATGKRKAPAEPIVTRSRKRTTIYDAD
jgi:hypothetical protein